MGTGVADYHGCFGGPEEAGGDAAYGTAEEEKAGGWVGVVCVESGAV